MECVWDTKSWKKYRLKSRVFRIPNIIPEDAWKTNDGQAEQLTQTAKHYVNCLRNDLVTTFVGTKMQVYVLLEQEQLFPCSFVNLVHKELFLQ